MANLNNHPLKDWNKEEKLRLYYILRTHGSRNLSRIQESFPDKDKEDIERVMMFFKEKALKQEEDSSKRKERTRVRSSPYVPLNSWAKLLTESIPFDDLRTETAAALRLIADFEKIPKTVCTDKIDFRKVYHTLANALEGKALCEDNYVAAVIDKCITETALTSKTFMRCNAFKNALKDIRLNESNISPFIKPTDNNELSILRYIIMLKNYNPMNIPEEHLKFSVIL